MHFVLIHQIHAFTEEADLYKRSSHILFWVGMEQQGSGTFQVTALIKPEFLQQAVIIVHQICIIHTSAPFGILAEQIECGIIQILRFQIRYRYTIPRFSLLAKHETVECSPFQFLIGSPTPLVILSTKTNGIRISLCHNLQILLSVFLFQINIHQDAHHVAHLVRNVLHQLLGILYTAHFAIVLYTHIKGAALCIGKTAYPFLVFVAPRFFELYVLGFGIHVFLLNDIAYMPQKYNFLLNKIISYGRKNEIKSLFLHYI